MFEPYYYYAKPVFLSSSRYFVVRCSDGKQFGFKLPRRSYKKFSFMWNTWRTFTPITISRPGGKRIKIYFPYENDFQICGQELGADEIKELLNR